MTQLVAPFPWFGGKRTIAAEVWQNFGEVRNYVEPFFGSGAVLLSRDYPLRVAVAEGNANACSMLYGACSRAAKAMGAGNLVTYTHLDEHGASLKASNWIEGGDTDGGEWIRPGSGRQNSLAIDPLPKRRWWAPWSERAKAAP